MKVIAETTKWDMEYAVPNHVYFVNDSQDKMFAYVPAGSLQVSVFKKPIKFSTSRRSFKEIPNSWGYQEPERVPEEPVVSGQTFRVPGSKGAVYTVANDNGSWTCTCPASRWQRGECKHIQQLKSA